MKGWKTLLVGAGLTLVGVVEQGAGMGLIPAEYSGLALSAAGTLMMVLRLVTDSPVGRK